MGMTNKSLREARLRADLTIEDVAVRIRILPDRITRWEMGTENPDTETLYALSALYDTPPHKLLMGAPQLGTEDREQPLSEEREIVPALDAFRRELNAMREIELLPLDDETIDYCVGKMRDRLSAEKTPND